MTDFRIRPGPGVARPYRFPTTESHTLSNGMRVFIAPLRRLPAATVLFLAPAGGEEERFDDAGLASLTALGLSEGTTQRSASALAASFEQLGGEMFSGAEWTHAACGTTVLASRLDATLALMAEAVQLPLFPADGVDRLRQERLAELLQQQTEPRGLADDLLLESCFLPGDRRARPLAGDMTTVARHAPEHVRLFHQLRYAPADSVLIVTGDVDVEGVVRQTTEVFGGWQTSPEYRKPGFVNGMTNAAVPARRIRLLHRADAPQSEVRVGHISLPRTHPDFHAAAIMNAILGGLFNSRINLNLRERHAYTYGAFSAFDWRRKASLFSASTAVQSEVTGPAVREILAEVERIREVPVSSDELSLARDYLIGVFPLRFETTATIADAIATRIAYDLDPSYYDTYREKIGRVEADDVRRVAKTHLDPDLLQIVVVGDAGVSASSLDAIGAGAIERIDPAT